MHPNSFNELETPISIPADPTAPQNAELELRVHNADVVRADIADGRQSLAVLLKSLAGRGITRLMVEGGPTIAAAFVDAAEDGVPRRAKSPHHGHL